MISTGNELVLPGRPIADHQVRDSNAYALRAALREHGVTDVDCEHVADDEALLERSVRKHLAERDLIVLTGGVSHGKLDVVRAALAAIGVREGGPASRAEARQADVVRSRAPKDSPCSGCPAIPSRR